MKPVFLVAAIVVVGAAGLAVNYLKPSQSQASVEPSYAPELRSRLPADEGDGFFVEIPEDDTPSVTTETS